MGFGKMMHFTVMLIVTTTLVLINFSPSAYSQTYVNLTDILSSPGAPFNTFLSSLEFYQVIQIMQAQADNTQNNAQDGLTLFAPNDVAIASGTPPPVPLGTLSVQQYRSVLLFHAIPQYYAPAALSTLSQIGPVATMAGASYTLNFTFVPGTLHLSSGWSNAKVLSAVNTTSYPIAVYQIDEMLYPEAIFGTNIPAPSTSTTSAPPPPATTAATPTTSTPSAPPPPIATTPATPTTSTPTAPPPPSTPTTTITISHTNPAASLRIVGLGGWSRIVLGVSGGILLLL